MIEQAGQEDLPANEQLKSLQNARADSNQQKILYIEDNPDNTLLVGAIIKRMPQFSFMEAPNAEIGLELIAELRPAIVLMDIDLPGMNGFTAFEEMQRRFPFAKQTIVIGISANVLISDVEKALELGFFDYLTKPINILALQETLIKASAAIAETV
jgi:CheY-like chemotaxis protein